MAGKDHIITCIYYLFSISLKAHVTITKGGGPMSKIDYRKTTAGSIMMSQEQPSVAGVMTR